MSRICHALAFGAAMISLVPLFAACDADDLVAETDGSSGDDATSATSEEVAFDPRYEPDELLDPVTPSGKIAEPLPGPSDDPFEPQPQPQPQPYPQPPPVDDTPVLGRRSLIETNQVVLQQFSMDAVLTAVIGNSGSTGTSTALHDQIFEAFKTKAAGAPGVQHCDDVKVGLAASINGFPILCPRPEGGLVGKMASWKVLALVNRFDLAPTNGADCGEQRVILANTAVTRAFVIFEAKIPNPKPMLGVQGCRPVAQFWADLSGVNSTTTRAARLKQAFLTGEPTLTSAGFAPFMKAQHFTDVAGQIRTNNFVQAPWTLREHKLVVAPVNGVQRVVARLSPVANDSHGPTWDETKVTPNGAACRQAILDNLGTLLGDDMSVLGISLPKACWSGESRDDADQDYPFHLTKSPTFRQQIAAKVQALKPGSTLTTAQVANRARFASSCIGCHQQATGQSIGGGLTTPASLSFVHVSEQASEPCGDGTTCFQISPALKNVFLPKRLDVLNEFLGVAMLTAEGDEPLPLAAAVPDPPASGAARTLGGAIVGAH